MANSKALRNVQYAAVLDAARKIAKEVKKGLPVVAIEAFLTQMRKELGRDITVHQVELCLNENNIPWVSVFESLGVAKRHRGVTVSLPVVGRQEFLELREAMRRVEQDVRLLQTHTAELLRRLPVKTTISPTQTMFMEADETK
jgi:hypothetical protein